MTQQSRNNMVKLAIKAIHFTHFEYNDKCNLSNIKDPYLMKPWLSRRQCEIIAVEGREMLPNTWFPVDLYYRGTIYSNASFEVDLWLET